MTPHRTTGQAGRGLALALAAALLWGLLPVAMKGVLDRLDAFTVTWVRFASAGLVLAAVHLPRRGWPPLRSLGRSFPLLLLVAAAALCGNYVLYVLGLDRLTPSSTQVVIQLAPMLLLLGSLAVYREPFSRLQWAGVAVFTAGLALFFHDRLAELVTTLSGRTLGVLLVAAAAAAWAAYALAQKQLLRVLGSGRLLLLVFAAGAAAFLPLVRFGALASLDPFRAGLLAFCALNTLLAYGAFAEALRHWEASRVSAVLTVVPIVTVAAMAALRLLLPAYLPPEGLGPAHLGGAGLVVAGSLCASLARPVEKRAPMAYTRGGSEAPKEVP